MFVILGLCPSVFAVAVCCLFVSVKPNITGHLIKLYDVLIFRKNGDQSYKTRCQTSLWATLCGQFHEKHDFKHDSLQDTGTHNRVSVLVIYFFHQMQLRNCPFLTILWLRLRPWLASSDLFLLLIGDQPGQFHDLSEAHESLNWSSQSWTRPCLFSSTATLLTFHLLIWHCKGPDSRRLNCGRF